MIGLNTRAYGPIMPQVQQGTGSTNQPTSAASAASVDPKSYGGGFWNNLGDFIGWGTASRTRKYDAEQAEIDRQFQQNSADIAWDRQMEASNTAYQRATKDLEAAGLNPILAAGSSASTPNAATASGSRAQGGTQGKAEGIALISALTGSAEKISKMLGGKKPGFKIGFSE